MKSKYFVSACALFLITTASTGYAEPKNGGKVQEELHRQRSALSPEDLKAITGISKEILAARKRMALAPELAPLAERVENLRSVTAIASMAVSELKVPKAEPPDAAKSNEENQVLTELSEKRKEAREIFSKAKQRFASQAHSATSNEHIGMHPSTQIIQELEGEVENVLTSGNQSRLDELRKRLVSRQDFSDDLGDINRQTHTIILRDQIPVIKPLDKKKR